jgi:DNA-directed RNA polymerase specialized sigma24 family protein
MSARLDAWPEPPEPAQLRQLRLRLLRSTLGPAAHVPSGDAEDIVQNAMIRYLREPLRPGGPSEEIRAHVALKRERANYYRTRERKPEQLTDLPPAEQPAALPSVGAEPDPGFIDDVVTIEQIAGPDVRRLVELRGERCTLTDAAQALHWDTRRVEAARKQLERNKDRIARALNIQLKEDPNGV